MLDRANKLLETMHFQEPVRVDPACVNAALPANQATDLN
jgi:hypothetical protein